MPSPSSAAANGVINSFIGKSVPGTVGNTSERLYQIISCTSTGVRSGLAGSHGIAGTIAGRE